MIVRVADGSERRLVRGGAPAWSPDGLQIAYIASGGAVEIVAVHGGRSRRVGSVSGTALDWQPLPSSRGRACQRPAHATVLASTPEAVVFSQRGERFYGCLKALGVTRLLLDTNTQSAFGGTLTAVRLAGRFAALVPEYFNQYANWEDETLYDLSSGKTTLLAEVAWDCSLGCPPSNNIAGLDSLALDSSGFAAWREISEPIPAMLTALSCPSASLCVAGDNAGNILTASDPVAGPGAWSIAVADQGQGIVGVSCPSVSMCVAADGAGNIFVSSDPTGGESARSRTKTAGSGVLESVSCASVTLCVAVGDGPMMFTSSDPSGGPSAWSSARVGSGGDRALAVSCPSVSLCVATVATQNPGGVVTSTDPTGGARASKTTLVDVDDCIGQWRSCARHHFTSSVHSAPSGTGREVSSIGSLMTGCCSRSPHGPGAYPAATSVAIREAMMGRAPILRTVFRDAAIHGPRAAAVARRGRVLESCAGLRTRWGHAAVAAPPVTGLWPLSINAAISPDRRLLSRLSDSGRAERRPQHSRRGSFGQRAEVRSATRSPNAIKLSSPRPLRLRRLEPEGVGASRGRLVAVAGRRRLRKRPPRTVERLGV